MTEKLTQKYTIVHSFQSLEDGFEYSMDQWPLHVTLADVFAMQGTPEELLASLAEKLHGYEPVTVDVVDDAWFGPHRNVHVKLLDNSYALQSLHEMILVILSKFEASYNSPQYTGAGFKPHSTVIKGEMLNIGDTITIDSATLIDMFPDENPSRRRVLGTIHF